LPPSTWGSRLPVLNRSTTTMVNSTRKRRSASSVLLHALRLVVAPALCVRPRRGGADDGAPHGRGVRDRTAARRRSRSEARAQTPVHREGSGRPRCERLARRGAARDPERRERGRDGVRGVDEHSWRRREHREPELQRTRPNRGIPQLDPDHCGRANGRPPSAHVDRDHARARRRGRVGHESSLRRDGAKATRRGRPRARRLRPHDLGNRERGNRRTPHVRRPRGLEDRATDGGR